MIINTKLVALLEKRLHADRYIKCSWPEMYNAIPSFVIDIEW